MLLNNFIAPENIKSEMKIHAYEVTINWRHTVALTTHFYLSTNWQISLYHMLSERLHDLYAVRHVLTGFHYAW